MRGYILYTAGWISPLSCPFSPSHIQHSAFTMSRQRFDFWLALPVCLRSLARVSTICTSDQLAGLFFKLRINHERIVFGGIVCGKGALAGRMGSVFGKWICMEGRMVPQHRGK